MGAIPLLKIGTALFCFLEGILFLNSSFFDTIRKGDGMEEKLQIISSIFHYFIFNKDLISSTNIKEQILKRLENNESFSEIDKEISHKYITNPSPEDDLNSKEITEVEEEISIEDFFKKYQNK